MKITFLNTWNGKVREAITGFIIEQTRDTDIFCFQEAYDEMRTLCRELLSDYVEIYAYKFITKEDDFPQAIYLRKGIDILSSGVLFQEKMDQGLGIWIQIKFEGKDLWVCNYHGMSRPVDKIDNAGRLNASRGLIDFFKDKEGLKVIGGDFNILQDTHSIDMFEESGYKDLIKGFKISTTRNRFAWELYPHNKQYHSDYVFVSPDVSIKNFSVLNNEISDHLPLILDIGLKIQFEHR